MKKLRFKQKKESNKLLLASILFFPTLGLVAYNYQSKSKKERIEKRKGTIIPSKGDQLKQDSSKLIPSKVETSTLFNSSKEFAKKHYGKGLLGLGGVVFVYFLYSTKKLKEKKKEIEKARLENIRNNPNKEEEEKLVKLFSSYLVNIVFELTKLSKLRYTPISYLIYEEGFRRSLLNNLFSLLQHMKERDSKKWMKWTISHYDVAKEIARYIMNYIVFNYVEKEEWNKYLDFSILNSGIEDLANEISKYPLFRDYIIGKEIEDSRCYYYDGIHNLMEKGIMEQEIKAYDQKIKEIVDSFNEEEGAYYQAMLKWDRRTKIVTYSIRTSLELAKEAKRLKKAFEIIEFNQKRNGSQENHLADPYNLDVKLHLIADNLMNKTIYNLYLTYRKNRKPINPQPQSAPSTNNINNQNNNNNNNNNNNIKNQNQDNTQHLNPSPQTSNPQSVVVVVDEEDHSDNDGDDNHSNHSHNSNHSIHTATPAPSPQLEEF